MSTTLTEPSREQSRFEAALKFLSSEYMEAFIGQEVGRAVVRSQSEVLSRQDAALFLGNISESTLDGFVRDGLLAPSYAGGSPKFLKSDLLAALTSGRLDTRKEKQ